MKKVLYAFILTLAILFSTVGGNFDVSYDDFVVFDLPHKH
ncbi:hypothetical protein SAMN05216352_102318 [Alteribacillus bidgolensis]|uniref:Uncharacterized protein n=1 Tax=Alteribacillus bidgolensis TaxID=930129 RepID=A0A1G8EPB1_9BACI|nr:hypothetical protein SAMN05216352_102318 [Alteribacillus bidgolensis]